MDECISCLFCGQDSTYSYYNRIQKNEKSELLWTDWKSKCGNAICTLLSLPCTQPWTNIFTFGSYCKVCLELVLNAEFTMREFDLVQKRLKSVQTSIETCLVKHFKKLKKDLTADEVKLEINSSKVKAGVKRTGLTDKDLKKYHVIEKVIKELEKRPEFILTEAQQSQQTNYNDETQLNVNVIKSESVTDDESKSIYNTNRIKRKAAQICELSFKSLSEPNSNVSIVCSREDDDYSGHELSSDAPRSSGSEADSRHNNNVTEIREEKKSINLSSRKRKSTLDVNGKRKEYIYPCEDCGQSFTTRVRFREHRKSKHKNPAKPSRPHLYKCTKCEFDSTNRYKIHLHMRFMHPEVTFPCTFCLKVFKVQESLDAHIKLQHNQNYSFYCPICDKGCHTEQDLEVHSQCHNTDIPFKCCICDAVFTNSQDLQMHVRGHDNRFKCPQCAKCFPSSDGLEIHMKHHEDTTYKCRYIDICNSTFTSRINRTRHEKCHARPRQKDFPCDQCHLAYYDKYQLRRHQRTHTGERRYICKICGKQFYNGQTLRNHEETHSGIKPYICSICGKAFRARQNLSQHELIHDTTKPKKKRIRVKKAKNILKPNEMVQVVAVPELEQVTEDENTALWKNEDEGVLLVTAEVEESNVSINQGMESIQKVEEILGNVN